MADSYFKQSKTLIFLSVLGILIVFVPSSVTAQDGVETPTGQEETGEPSDNKTSDDVPVDPKADPEGLGGIPDPEAASEAFNKRLMKGGALAITGMAVVFVGLLAISVFIAVLPHALEVVNQVLPESDHHHGHAAPAKKTAPLASSDDEEAIVAGIAFAIHSRNR
jgi:Na+-transporting methylmalonyl-CoA/oxaloacetate decarboxylase gamma subunit